MICLRANVQLIYDRMFHYVCSHIAMEQQSEFMAADYDCRFVSEAVVLRIP